MLRLPSSCCLGMLAFFSLQVGCGDDASTVTPDPVASEDAGADMPPDDPPPPRPPPPPPAPPTDCTTQTDCDDGDSCNGIETCDAGRCVVGAAPDCDDGDPCTRDVCSPASAGDCAHFLIDEDLDGHAPSILGACGTDCDDADPSIFSGAVDGCDGADGDCDGTIDEDFASVWFADCDGDGYAAGAAMGHAVCPAPTIALAGCPDPTTAAWITRAPLDPSSTDCHDGDPLANPGQTAFQRTPMSIGAGDRRFDYDCDGEVQSDPPVPITWCTTESGTCRAAMTGWFEDMPSCGDSGLLLVGCRMQGDSCVPGFTLPVTRACR